MVNVIEEGVLFTGDIINNKHFSFMGHGNFKGAYEATLKALAMKPKYVVVGHGRSGGISLIEEFSTIYKKLHNEVGKYYSEGLMSHEMKPKIVYSFSQYKHWSSFDKRIGEYVSQVKAEIENEEFNQ